MEQLSKDRKHAIYNVFALISAILSLGHFIVLQFSIDLSRQLDDYYEKITHVFKDWDFKQNLPFAVVLGVFALVQFCSSISIMIFNRSNKSAKTLYYNSLVGVLVTFALGVSLTILASEYNTITRTYPKNSNEIPTFMPFYWLIQVDATATFLFSLPMLLFIFYSNLEEYFKQQREQTQPNLTEGQARNCQAWLIVLFLFNSFAQIAFIFNTYQFVDKEDTKDYNLEDLADQYTFFLAVGTAISLAAIFAQVKNHQNQFLKKNQLVLVALLPCLFQFGSFILMVVKTCQIHIEILIMEADQCYFLDCDEANVFRWEITAYTAVNLLALLGQIPYFRAISVIIEKDYTQTRDTLLTNE